MNILEARIDWLLDLGNLPMLVITVDKIPAFEGAIYTQQPNGMVYAVKEGVVEYIRMGQPTESGITGGFGGREHTRTLTDGTVLKSRDCWSGSSSVLNFECMEVTVVETDDKNSMYAVSTGITYELAKELVGNMEGAYLVPYVMAEGTPNESHWWVPSRSPDKYEK